MFAQYVWCVAFQIFTFYTPLPVFCHIWKKYKIGLEEKGGGVQSPCGLATGHEDTLK